MIMILSTRIEAIDHRIMDRSFHEKTVQDTYAATAKILSDGLSNIVRYMKIRLDCQISKCNYFI